MTKAMCFFTAVLLAASLGCAPRPVIDNAINNDNVVVAVEKGAKSVVNLALIQCAKKDKEAALKIANETNKVLIEVIIPYLNSQEVGVTSFVINEYLKEKCFTKLSEEVVTAIAAAAEIVDALVQPPGPNSQMTEAELRMLRAFFNGVQKGVEKFISNQIPRMGMPKAGWFK